MHPSHCTIPEKNTVHSKSTQAAQHGATSQTKSMLRRSQHSLRKPTTLHGNDNANNRICFTNACKTTQKLKIKSSCSTTHFTEHTAQSKHDQRCAKGTEQANNCIAKTCNLSFMRSNFVPLISCEQSCSPISHSFPSPSHRRCTNVTTGSQTTTTLHLFCSTSEHRSGLGTSLRSHGTWSRGHGQQSLGACLISNRQVFCSGHFSSSIARDSLASINLVLPHLDLLFLITCKVHVHGLPHANNFTTGIIAAAS